MDEQGNDQNGRDQQVDRRPETRIEKKFWHQTTFRVFVVTGLLVALIVPITIRLFVTQVFSSFFPLTISWFGLEILTLLALIVLWAWPRKYMKQLVWGWVVITFFLLVKRPSFVIASISGISFMVWAISQILILTGLALWTKKCLDQIGDRETPAQGILVRFGRAIRAVGPGLYFQLWPFEMYKEFPTGQYNLNYEIRHGLYSKESGKLASQPLEVEISLYLRFPQIGLEYSFPRITEGDDGEKVVVWGRTMGEELMLKLFRRLPVKNLRTPEAKHEIGRHFKEGVLGGVRHVMSTKSSKACKENKPRIEAEIKQYLLTETGDPFFECGIPAECISVEMTSVKLPDETEKAYIKPELARKDAEAAVYKKESIKTLMSVLVEKNVTPDLAALIVGPEIKGDPLKLEELRDLAIAGKIFSGADLLGGQERIIT